jgi:hypothetical protein
MGLLSRALKELQKNPMSQVSDEFDGIDFYADAQHAGLNSCAVLVEIDSVFCVKQFYGFCARTIVTSVSSADFWDGAIRRDEDYFVVTKDELSPFYQLFAEADTQNLRSLLLKRFKLPDGTNAIWLCYGDETAIPASDELLAKIAQTGIDFLHAEPVVHQAPKDIPGNLFEIDFSDVVEALPPNDANYSLELLLSLSRTIFYGAYKLCHALFQNPNGCYLSRDTCLRTVVYSACEIDSFLLNTQLQQILTPYFSSDVLEALQIYEIGAAVSEASILSFLQTAD